MNVQPFSPGATASISASVTTANVALTGNGSVVEFYNSGTTLGFVKLGSSSAVTAAVTDYPVAAGSIRRISRDPSTQTFAAAIMASSTATIYCTVGEGV